MRVQKVQLKFDSLLSLWCFKQKVQAPHIRIDPNQHLLTAELPDTAIDLALRDYKAEVLTFCNTDNSFTSPLH